MKLLSLKVDDETFGSLKPANICRRGLKAKMSGVEEQGAAQKGGDEDSIKVICRFIAPLFCQSFSHSSSHDSVTILATILVTILARVLTTALSTVLVTILATVLATVLGIFWALF